ncbi:uncharacterized protein LOC125480667 isoform X1 [Pyrus x bretschneideri]|uniref:uncharacterized protein LOC125480667 isoform X1 n=1 Tax=Pyrus x bretschneideri TaxID=225117 RepID=UPI0020306D2B|nr:uncharacterized protein LOC125480667 isoform X1 [Pyrus x bretschneideri]
MDLFMAMKELLKGRGKTIAIEHKDFSFLHPKLKPKFTKYHKMIHSNQFSLYKTQYTTYHSSSSFTKGIQDFISNPVFASYLQNKGCREDAESSQATTENPIALLGQLAGFLAKLQDSLTKKTIGEGFFLNGLYYLCKEPHIGKAFQVDSIPSKDQQIRHQRLAYLPEAICLNLFPKCINHLQCVIYVSLPSLIDSLLVPQCIGLANLLNLYTLIFGVQLLNLLMNINILLSLWMIFLEQHGYIS